MSIREVFDELRANPSGHTYTVAPLPSHDDVSLGVDNAGRPTLFARADRRSFDAPLRTAQVSLQPSQEYRIAGNGAERQLLHALRCESNEPSAVSGFLILIEAFLAHHAEQRISGDELAAFFRSMVRLFSTGPARDLQSERQGLWGELFVMQRVRGYRFWAPFWHSEVTRVFDFSTHTRRVEVKTAVGGQRIHHFSHRQVFAVADEQIVIASLLLREDDVGLSVRQLIAECRTALLGTPHFLKLERAVRHAGMEDLDLEGATYDAADAERQLAWFRAADTPHFRLPEPPGVSDTRYRIDLATAPRLEGPQLGIWLDSWHEVAHQVAQGYPQ